MSSPIIARGLSNTGSLIDKLIRRSLIGNIYPESDEFHSKLRGMLMKPVAVYSGFDATSNSLHVGNLATIMNLLHFHRHGHQVICVIGDATTQIGDPSGHTKERAKLDRDSIDQNANAIEEILRRLFTNYNSCFGKNLNISEGKIVEPVIVRNSTWYQDKNIMDFVGDVFREVRAGTLLQRKSIEERLNSPEGLNMAEFSYQIFQAYDWLELRRRYDCRIQIGGTDQAGNIYTGHDMIKKLTGHKDAIGLLAPLLTSASGKKLGKSSEGARSNIWLAPSRTSAFELYQYFHRVPDKDVERLLKVFSFYDDATIERLIYDHLKQPKDVWHCQKKLAEHVCQLVHGPRGLESAKRITHAFYSRGPEEIANLTDQELEQLFDENSIIRLLHTDELRVLDLTRRANCFNSDFDAERVISAGGLWINGARVTSVNVPITKDLILGNGITLMRIGKKDYFLFKWAY